MKKIISIILIITGLGLIIFGFINLKPSDSEKRKTFVYLSFLASLFIAISGVIFLFIATAAGISTVNIDSRCHYGCKLTYRERHRIE